MLVGFFRNFLVSIFILFRKSYNDQEIVRYWEWKKWIRVCLDITSVAFIAAFCFFTYYILDFYWHVITFVPSGDYVPDFTEPLVVQTLILIFLIFLLSVHLSNSRIIRQFLSEKQRLELVAQSNDPQTILRLNDEIQTLSAAKAAVEAKNQREVGDLRNQIDSVTKEVETLSHEKQHLTERLGANEADKTRALSSVEELNKLLERRSHEIEHLRAKSMQDALQAAAPNIITEELKQRLVKLRKSAPKDASVPSEASQYLSWIITTAHEVFPDELARFRDLSYVSEEAKRIAQYDSILSLYSDKIAKLRARDMNEEDREEAIFAMKRLRDKEIELLENAEVKGG